MNWARISPASKAVLPVIAAHCDESGKSFPGEETIAGLSGRTAKIVREGIRGLNGFPGFGWSPYTTRTGKRSKQFHLDLPPKGERGRSFFFYRGIIDAGTWAELKPTAQALYPVMRYFSIYDFYQDEDAEMIDDPSDAYTSREYEICEAETGILAKHAGIDRRSTREALQSLREGYLVEHLQTDNGPVLKVFLVPPFRHKASFLNSKLMGKNYRS